LVLLVYFTKCPKEVFEGIVSEVQLIYVVCGIKRVNAFVILGPALIFASKIMGGGRALFSNLHADYFWFYFSE